MSDLVAKRPAGNEQVIDEILISVIIPIYNAASFLDTCLKSVERQTFTRYEVIMVNDGSTDISQSIAEQFSMKDHRFRLINLHANRGLPGARNAGVREAQGRYILHLDSDDFWLESQTLKVLYTTAELEGTEVLRFNGRNYENGRLGNAVLPSFNAVNIELQSNRALWIFRSVFLFFFSRRFIEDHQLTFDENCQIGEDGIFLSKALPLARRISSVPNLFYAYRRHVDSMMGNSWGIGQFVEEKKGSDIVAANLAAVPAVRFAYLYQRYTDYWVNRLLPRIILELSSREQTSILSLYREALVEDKSSIATHIRGAVKFSIYLFFLRGQHYRALARFTRGFNGLTPVPYFYVGYYVYLIGLARRLTGSVVKKMKHSLSQRMSVRDAVSTGRRLFGAPSARHFYNIESVTEYHFMLQSEVKKPGITAMIRVKNEESNIADCIASVMPCVDEVLVIDNDSTDATVSKIQDLLQHEEFSKPLRLLSYPFTVARCGSEHAETHEQSVHSLSYYYNWCLSHCRTSHVIKWDADMRVMNEIGAQLGFSDFLVKLRLSRAKAVGSFPVQTIYLDKRGQAVTTSDDTHTELRLFPNTPDIYFAKGENWEYLRHPRFQPVERSSEVFCCEIKDTRQEEFAHWSAISFDGWRKSVEYRNYLLVARNLHMRESNFIPVQSHQLSDYKEE